MKEFSHEFIARLTQLDYARAMAFVAFDEVTREMLGVVRIHSDSIYETGEYAILLRSDLKGRGLGWALMQTDHRIREVRRTQTISGDVLTENTVMLAMCRSLGFEVTPDPTDTTSATSGLHSNPTARSARPHSSCPADSVFPLVVSARAGSGAAAWTKGSWSRHPE